jgi:2-C-methyl-D-erythritol 4-phosphate cytidylyltransferase/2-C-methyl-D-erythritol 2,4-cyclodiphosphate synthase
MIVVVVTAAGRSERFGGGKKELQKIGKSSVIDRSVSLFLPLKDLALLVVTAPSGGIDVVREALSPETRDSLGDRLLVVEGGASRRDSVRAGLEAIAKAIAFRDPRIKPESRAGRQAALRDAIVLVHDGARPWASPGLAASVAAAASEKGAAIPVLPLSDTPKSVSPDGRITGHPLRSSLAAAQTPQAFRFTPLLEAHRRAAAEGFDCTDDAELWAHYSGQVYWVAGEAENRKITFRADLQAEKEAEAPAARPAPGLRVGEGWDLHRLVPGRRLMLGGIAVPSELGEEAHSDGDVLLHAVIDALLGAAALGDIGAHFPPEDESWRDADSRKLAARAVGLVREAGYELVNLDCTVVLERPRLGPHRDAMRASMAETLGVDIGSISVKAKTSEGVDAAGEGRAIEARAIALLAKNS